MAGPEVLTAMSDITQTLRGIFVETGIRETQQAAELISLLRCEMDTLERFYRVAVAERDHAYAEIASLKAEIQVAKEDLFGACSEADHLRSLAQRGER